MSPTPNFPLTLNSTTSSKTEKQFPVPSLPSKNSSVKRKAERRLKSMASFAPKIKTPTKNGMMKDSTKETGKTLETSTKKF